MADHEPASNLPDLANGVPLTELSVGVPFFGTLDDEPIFLIRTDDDVRAFGAACTHYGGPLAEGLVHQGTVRCPLHHACFSLDDGTVRGGPAFNPLPRYRVNVESGRAIVGEALERDPVAKERSAPSPPTSVVIVGAGPAGTTCAETLLREGYEGAITLIDPDSDAPYDRPNLSKDYLSGGAPAEWLPLRSTEFFEEHGVRRVNARAVRIGPEKREVELDDGTVLPYGALLLSPGSTPISLPIPGADSGHVHTLRSLRDCDDIIQRASNAERAVIVGSSFVGMEVAASLRTRGLHVTVVAPESVPFERTLGKDLGTFLRSLHEEHGVEFRLGRTVSEIRSDAVILDDGTRQPGDLVVIGVGVRPDVRLAEEAGLDVGDGILVDAHMRTSDAHVFAAGDVANYPDGRTGRRVRIEHWVVAGRQGRTAARNMVGREEAFTDVPFFWTEHYGVSVRYVGRADGWDVAKLEGDCADGSCSVTLLDHERPIALATVGLRETSLRTEAKWEEEGRRASPTEQR